MELLKCKGYTAHLELDAEGEIFHGEVLDTRDVITFQGESVDELQEAFRESIDDYLELCAQRGEEPDKPFSGRLMVRTARERGANPVRGGGHRLRPVGA